MRVFRIVVFVLLVQRQQLRIASFFVDFFHLARAVARVARAVVASAHVAIPLIGIPLFPVFLRDRTECKGVATVPVAGAADVPASRQAVLGLIPVVVGDREQDEVGHDALLYFEVKTK